MAKPSVVEKKDVKGAADAAVSSTQGGSMPLDVKKENAVATPGIDFAHDAGSGMEGADRDSFAIPFLSVLQGLSPQVMDGMEGARPGVMINTVTNELLTKAHVVPCAFRRSFLRWAPRDEGGGFKGEYTPSEVDVLMKRGEAVRDDAGRLMIEGDTLRDTRQHFVLLVSPDGGWTPAVMSMASTQVKVSKRWMAQMQSIQLKDSAGRPYTPPSFSHTYRVETAKQQNDSGTWYVFAIGLEGPINDPMLYQAAKAFNQQVVSGAVKVQPPQQDDGGAGDGEGGAGGF